MLVCRLQPPRVAASQRNQPTRQWHEPTCWCTGFSRPRSLLRSETSQRGNGTSIRVGVQASAAHGRCFAAKTGKTRTARAYVLVYRLQRPSSIEGHPPARRGRLTSWHYLSGYFTPFHSPPGFKTNRPAHQTTQSNSGRLLKTTSQHTLDDGCRTSSPDPLQPLIFLPPKSSYLLSTDAKKPNWQDRQPVDHGLLARNSEWGKGVWNDSWSVRMHEWTSIAPR
ncbi:hypothetical protein TBK1r_02460 [Stieleria magnilauensis]|uniref:Uncharacterized protein n=1 Tax=Stieleria magnilauensis TaxID=2527963 RepID=A0ABX5XL12_9BACT|nr:hypothetical protein TBK1r_02460 [Planctomycetes bacterium TBK1r]